MMKINTEKLANVINDIAFAVERGGSVCAQPIGIIGDGDIVVVAVYSESEAIEYGFEVGNIDASIIEFEGQDE